MGRVKGPKNAIVGVDARRKRAFPDRGANDFTSHRRLNGPPLKRSRGQIAHTLYSACPPIFLFFFSPVISLGHIPT